MHTAVSTLLVGGCIMLWLGPIMPLYGWETGGCRLIVGGWAWGGVGGSARSGWPPPEPKFGKESWELGRGTVTYGWKHKIRKMNVIMD